MRVIRGTVIHCNALPSHRGRKTDDLQSIHPLASMGINNICNLPRRMVDIPSHQRRFNQRQVVLPTDYKLLQGFCEMTYTPTDTVVDRLKSIETTIRISTMIIAFILGVGFSWIVGEVKNLQDLHTVDAIEVVE